MGLVVLIFGLWIATDLAPYITIAAQNVNFTMPEGATMISSICDGANPLTWVIVRLNGLGIVGVAISAAIALAMAIWNRARIKKEALEMHAQ